MTRKPFLFTLIAALAFCTTVSLAARTPKRTPGAEKPIEHLRQVISQLQLTTDQQGKVDTIISNLQTALTEARSDAKSGDKDAAKSKGKDAMKSAISQISEVLTPDQKTKFKELLKEERAKNKEAKGAATQPSADQK